MTWRTAAIAFVAGVTAWTAAAADRIVLPATATPVHYDIAVVPDSAHLTFKGSVTIDIDVAKPTHDIVLNAADLTLARVKLDKGSDTPKITLDDAAQTATFTFANELASGRHRLTINYVGKIYEQASGLFALDYKAGKRTKRALFTQFENSDARRFVPCWDEPNRKATFALTVTVPKRDLAVSNMPVAKTERAGRGLKRVRFQTSPRMSSYLLFLSTGDMERISRRVGKVDVGVVVKRGDRARARYALDAAVRILPYYNDYFGTPYPLPKLDAIAGPGSSQFFGAMENWGAIFYFERAILVDPRTTTENDRRRVFNVIAHEMAHQWFGNLVTMDWWDDLWLNEGYATWMAFKADDHFHPEWSVALDKIDSKDRAMGRDARIGTHPVVQPILDVNQASQAFDAITYQKGSAVISMIEDYVGETAFRDGVRNYIAAHAYGNAVTDDLWRELDKVAQTSVTDIAHDFTLQDGIPLIHVEETSKGLRLEQSRYKLDDSGRETHEWRVPVIAAGGGKPWRGVVTGDGAKAPLDASQGAVVNAGQTGYYKTLYTPDSFAKLANRFQTLEPADQLGLIYDARALGFSGDAPLSNLLALARTATPKLHPHVLTVVTERLQGLDAYHKDLPTQDAYRRYARGILKPIFAEVGWTPERREPADQPLLRAALLDALSQLDDADVVAEAKRRFARLVAHPNSVAAEERRAVLGIAARHADIQTWEKLLRLAKTAPTNVEKERFYILLGRAVDPALADRALDLALKGDLAPTTRPNIIEAVSAEFPEKAFDFVVAHRETVMTWLEPTSRDEYVVDLLGAGQEQRLIDKLRAYAKEHIPETAHRAADVIEGTIALAVQVREKRLPELDKWIAAGGS